MRKIGRRSPQSSSAPVTRSFIHAPRGLKEMRAGRRRFSAPAEKSACRKAFSGRRVEYTGRKILRNLQAHPQSSSAPVTRSSILAPRGLKEMRAGRRRFSAPAEKSACRKAFSDRRIGYAARKILRNQPHVHRIGKRPDADQKHARPSTRRADCKNPEQSIGALLIPENISMSEQPSSVRFSGIAVSYARHALFAKSAARPAQRQLRSGTANARTRLNRQPLVRKIEKRPAPEQCIETLSMSAKKQYAQSNVSQRKGTPLGLRPHIRLTHAACKCRRAKHRHAPAAHKKSGMSDQALSVERSETGTSNAETQTQSLHAVISTQKQQKAFRI